MVAPVLDECNILLVLSPLNFLNAFDCDGLTNLEVLGRSVNPGLGNWVLVVVGKPGEIVLSFVSDDSLILGLPAPVELGRPVNVELGLLKFAEADKPDESDMNPLYDDAVELKVLVLAELKSAVDAELVLTVFVSADMVEEISMKAPELEELIFVVELPGTKAVAVANSEILFACRG